MGLREQIENYLPYNEQEIKDKEIILNYIDLFDDVLTRENEITHFCSSGFIVNQARDKVLMIYHNIYKSWAWTGGHADGEEDFLSVAIREAQEESSIKSVVALSDEIFAIDTLPVLGHFKRGKYVPAHIHISIAYLLEASEDELLRIKEDENSNVAWLSMEDFLTFVSEEYMKPVYTKIVEKAKKLEYIKNKSLR